MKVSIILFQARIRGLKFILPKNVFIGIQNIKITCDVFYTIIRIVS